MLIIRNFGTLYLAGKPIEAGTEYRWERTAKEIRENPDPKDPSIAIGDTDPAHPIGWFPVGNILVPTQDLLIGVSWRDLDANGLAPSKEVTIDGLPHLLRLFKVGNTYQDPGEWGQFVEFVSEKGFDPNLSNYEVWADSPTIKFENGQTSIGVDLQRMHLHCGPIHTSTWDGVAWRPVLEPICINLGPDLIGKRLGVWTKTQELVSGLLTDISSYDIALAGGERIFTGGRRGSNYVQKYKDTLVVSHDGISSVQVYTEN